MRPIRVAVGSATVSAPIPLNTNVDPFNVSIGVTLSAGASLTYKVQYTYDDVWDPAFNAATATWFDHATITGKIASFDGNFTSPVVACRLNVTPYTSGTATMTVLQAGVA